MSLISVSFQALDTIGELLSALFGANSYERIDGGIHSAQRHAAIKRFSQPDAQSWWVTRELRILPISHQPQAYSTDRGPGTELLCTCDLSCAAPANGSAVCRTRIERPTLLCRLIMLQYLVDSLLCWRSSGGLHVVRAARCCRVFLHAAGSCGLGTDLPSISAVVVHDSDWDPRADLQVPSPHHLTSSCN